MATWHNPLDGCRLAIGTLQWSSGPLSRAMLGRPDVPGSELSAIVRRCVGGGVWCFDTAEGYGGGDSERRLAAALQDGAPGARICVMSKFLPTFWRMRRADVVAAARASQERLGGRVIDVLFIHTPVHWARPVEFWVEGALDAVEAGFARSVGLSNCGADEVLRAHAVAKQRGMADRLVANQIKVSLLDFASPKLQTTLAACRRLGIRIVAYSPIGQGLLCDGLTPEKFGTIRTAKMTGLALDDLGPLRAEIRRIADKRGGSMAQVCIAWCMAHDTIPLVGSRSESQAADTLGALEVDLSADDVAALDRAALGRSTLEGSTRKRTFFATLFGAVMVLFRIESFVRSLVGLRAP